MPTPRLHVALRRPEEVIPHLGRGKDHWRDGFSAQALCTSWHQANGFPNTVRSVLTSNPALARLELLDAFLERQVDLGDGRQPSQADLMAICADSAGLFVVGIEGKVEEPFGKYVSAWRDGSPGKEARLRNLCSLLGLAIESVDRLRYQLLHRTASSLLEARRYRASRAAMIVHSFSAKKTGLIEFSQFSQAMGFGEHAPNVVLGPRRVDTIDLFLGWVADTLPRP